MKNEIRTFIIDQIELLSKKFPNMSFKYGYDINSHQHLIDVEPDSAYRNEIYMQEEFNVVDSFIDRFPKDEILFISNNKYIKIENPIYIKEGLIHVSSDLVTISESADSISHIIAAPLEFPGHIIAAGCYEIEISKTLIENLNNFLIKTTDIKVSDSNYAMAA